MARKKQPINARESASSLFISTHPPKIEIKPSPADIEIGMTRGEDKQAYINEMVERSPPDAYKLVVLIKGRIPMCVDINGKKYHGIMIPNNTEGVIMTMFLKETK